MQSSSEIKEKKSEEEKDMMHTYLLEDKQFLKACNSVVVDTTMFDY